MFKEKSIDLSKLKQTATDLPKCVEENLKKVEHMDKKTYLKYYIKVLERQINEASKILNQKRKELEKLK